MPSIGFENLFGVIPGVSEWTMSLALEPKKEQEKSTDQTVPANRVLDDLITCALTSQTVYRLPEIAEVIFNEEAGVTVLIWVDGEKTIVRLGEGERFDRYTGFMAAVCKRLFGGTATAKKLMNAKDRKYQAALRAEKEAKEKAKRIIDAEKLREKAKRRREKEETEGFDTLVQYYVREFRAKDKAREIVKDQTEDAEGKA